MCSVKVYLRVGCDCGTVYHFQNSTLYPNLPTETIQKKFQSEMSPQSLVVMNG